MIHPVRKMFQHLTERGMSQINFRDRDAINYITDLLTEFVHIKNMYRLEVESGAHLEYIWELAQAVRAAPASKKREYSRQLGDLTLFYLGLFPESLSHGRRLVSPSYYAAQGARSYHIAAEMQPTSDNRIVFRKLSAQFEDCVHGLNWVKLYINDPFYQYMLREFEVT